MGHAGTLDPNAEGLMLLATDKYTKLFNYTQETDKTYKVSTLFGHSSDSIDTIKYNNQFYFRLPPFCVNTSPNQRLKNDLEHRPMT